MRIIEHHVKLVTRFLPIFYAMTGHVHVLYALQVRRVCCTCAPLVRHLIEAGLVIG